MQGGSQTFQGHLRSPGVVLGKWDLQEVFFNMGFHLLL